MEYGFNPYHPETHCSESLHHNLIDIRSNSMKFATKMVLERSLSPLLHACDVVEHPYNFLKKILPNKFVV